MLMRLKIGTRLGLAFGALLLLLVIMAGVGLKTMQEMSGYTEQLSNTSVRQMANASMILREMLVQTRYMRNFLLKPADQREGELDKLKESEGAYGAIVTRTEAALYAPRGRALFAAIKAAQARTLPIRERVITLARAGKGPEASGVLYRELTPAAQEWEQAITAFRDFQIEQATLRYQTSETARKAAARGIYVLAFLALGIGITLAVLITRSITGPVKDMVESLGALSEGDLTREPAIEGRDELAQMAEALVASLQSLRTTLGQVQESAGVVSGAASEISAGNNDLSRRTEQQAASLEETASTLEEFTSTIAQTNQNTRGATATTSRAQGIATQGSDEVGRLVAAMGDINRSSERIAEIIGVVDEIAFQTNLLALNAAVEAARAGEQGRGFAVVASEVRNLAKRSADAAREIKGLIQDSVTKASSGSKVAEGAGRTMKDVVGGVAEVTVLMQDISRASEEQTRGIQEIQKAVAQMDTATQQNAALVEEAAAAAESLNEQAGNLMDLLRKFKIGDAGQSGVQSLGTRSRVSDLRRPSLRMTGS